jgi:hypothetical protein
MSMGYDIGASASTSSGAQSGAASTGEMTVTGGGGGGLLGSLLPKVTTSQAWIVYAILGVVAVFGLYLFARRKP